MARDFFIYTNFASVKLMLDIDIPAPPAKISYSDKLLLAGSCFTRNVGKALEEAKFSSVYNPTGILFDPLSVARHIGDMVDGKVYSEEDLFRHDELWKSWLHHSEFSAVEKKDALHHLNAAVKRGSDHLTQSSWLLITLGTAFSYRLSENNMPVANCHKAPSQWFTKHLLEIDEIYASLNEMLEKLFSFNKDLNIVFTVSPVRHVRDGVIENNRSKARLIEAVHQLVEQNARCVYFPAYELVIDVLRDHRFYDTDLVHPNHVATQYVFEVFRDHYMDEGTRALMEEVRKIAMARQHRPQHPGTAQYKKFLETHLAKTKELREKLPMADWTRELEYFGSIK